MGELDELIIFKGHDGQWYWHRVALNHRVVSSGEAYTRRWSARRAALRANRDLGRAQLGYADHVPSHGL